ncbi:MAG: hypothetical protein HYZ42_07580 [Bacteroidetes bacterium]|nr:hypothetical protein [Bacteroidota bacterium]
MRKTLLALLGFVFILNVQAQKRKSTSTSGASHEVKKESTPNFSCPDFREMKWGTHRDSISINGTNISFQKANVKTDTSAYVIADDNMVIGTVICKNIYYYFNATGRLTKVKLVVPKVHKGEIKYILVSKFEEPTTISDLANGYQTIWNNIDEVRLVMTYFEDPVDFLTVEFMSDFELNESKKINKAVDDF